MIKFYKVNDTKDELFKGIEKIEVTVPVNYTTDISEEKKEEIERYFEENYRRGF